ncbi:unnamed protein product [Didymodactylos carnosus]|uniref:N-acetyltransferase domain-containing protein n=1 Tax=Didymodactylos carnosus TaxID=1234261 RepID=A0A815G7C7_9BILA|nr:unnamed protein product [Didymodactylos carnosus]CAF1334749.1 unnamed protein product [Didymodactylos carnosus]CAF4138030.1 unnamed protein product [Didymodactylos carnosus]CAF4191108.1 unnamed protein product [Didymodactylos carnosus]
MSIEIIPYQDEYKEEFQQLNYEWLNKYDLLEDYDVLILSDPQKTVLNNGGYIYLAQDTQTKQIIGTIGILKHDSTKCELIKMCVKPGYQQQGVARRLIEQCLKQIREQYPEIKKISLCSNSLLKAAIHLYKHYGFKYAQNEHRHLVTADIYMELQL